MLDKTKDFSKIFKQKMNRRGQALAITLIVVLTLVLTTTSLFYFLSNDREFNDNINKVGILDEVYMQESLINTQVNDIFDSATQEITKNDAKSVFIEKFSKELDKHANKDVDSIQVGLIKEQLIESNIDSSNGKLVFTPELGISKSNVVDGVTVIHINYKYKKSFEKVFK